MDNITHSLTGLVIARAGLNRVTPHATLLLIVSANAPDIDILALSSGAFAYFEAHRGYTHSLLCLPGMALICVLLVAAIYRQRLPWFKAWLLCCAGVGSHLLMDWTNSYGIRLLLPFSSRWLHLDWNSLYDGWIWVILGFAAIWPVFSRMVSSEIGERRLSPGRGTAVFGLAFLILFDCARALLHLRAVAQLESRLYNDAPAVSAAALPDAFNPFRWSGVVETAVDYRSLEINTLGQLDTEDVRQRYYKPAINPRLENAKASAPFHYFVYFARFPVWSEWPVSLNRASADRIELTDLRFGIPQAGSFHCIALEDAQARVLESWFTFGSGDNLGWGDARSSHLSTRRAKPRLAPRARYACSIATSPRCIFQSEPLQLLLQPGAASDQRRLRGRLEPS